MPSLFSRICLNGIAVDIIIIIIKFVVFISVVSQRAASHLSCGVYSLFKRQREVCYVLLKDPTFTALELLKMHKSLEKVDVLLVEEKKKKKVTSMDSFSFLLGPEILPSVQIVRGTKYCEKEMFVGFDAVFLWL